MKILFLSRWFPFPPDNGSKVRILNLLKILTIRNQVTLLSFTTNPDKLSDIDPLKSICEEIITIPWEEFKPSSIKSIFGFFSRNPRSIVDTFSPEMAQKIQEILGEQNFDLVLASQIEMASYRNYYAKQASIFDEVEIGVPLQRYTEANSLTSRFRQGITWFKHKSYLTQLLKSFPVCTVASKEESQLLIENGIRDENIFVIPNCVDVKDYYSFSKTRKSNTLIYTGSFRYHPNYEAMVWFLDRIFPAILEKKPDLQLLITGDHMNLPLPPVKNVRTTGYVDDIRPLIADAAISIVPLLSGGGTRLKILEAMALKTPVISTTKGAQGIEVTNGDDILLADTPQEFIQGVLKLLNNKSLREKLTDKGFNLVKKNYSPEAIFTKYEGLLLKAIEHPN